MGRHTALRGWVVALALSCGLGSSLQAMSLRELRALERSKPAGAQQAHYYLVGVLEGILEAWASAQRRGTPPPFCVQSRRPPQPAQVEALLQGERRRSAELYEADMPVELVLFNALVNAYPCD